MLSKAGLLLCSAFADLRCVDAGVDPDDVADGEFVPANVLWHRRRAEHDCDRVRPQSLSRQQMHVLCIALERPLSSLVALSMLRLGVP